jgi:anti-sigma B factor antagonist
LTRVVTSLSMGGARVGKPGAPAGSAIRQKLLERGQSVRIEVRFENEVAVVSLSGKFLAGGDGPFLRQKVKDLIEAGAKNMVIDFAGVPYIDSTGLGFLAGSRVTAQNSGVTMVLANVNEHVMRILDSVRLSQFFVIAADEKAALDQARQASLSSAGVSLKSEKNSKKKRPASPAD